MDDSLINITLMFITLISIAVMFQIKYKEIGKRDNSRPLYSQLLETSEIRFAKEISGIQSEVTHDLVLWKETEGGEMLIIMTRMQRLCPP